MPSASTPSASNAADASDNLMDPAQAAPLAELSPVPAGRLAALPKITGVRHWSSSMGSTVVIDMEDNVPYEVHRLMSPERIYFDLHDTVLPADLDGKTMDVGDASLTRVRVAQPVAGITRIVLDTIEGLKMSEKDLQELGTKMKKILATGGTVKDGIIILQGDHRERAVEILVKQGFSESSIEVI